MQCSKCGQQSREGARFCSECGASLITEVTCPDCGSSNNADQRFRDQCGHQLHQESSSSQPVVGSPPEPRSETKQPTAFSDGRYQVKRFLGEGGKKIVYLAQDTLLDRDVAFALIKSDGLDAISRTRISREAQAMGRLGSHPHVVTVFDLGDHEGQPFMVTELMGGGDVEAILEDSEGGKLTCTPWERCSTRWFVAVLRFLETTISP
jgi:serine/threonine protein kinase